MKRTDDMNKAKLFSSYGAAKKVADKANSGNSKFYYQAVSAVDPYIKVLDQTQGSKLVGYVTK